MQKMTVFKLCAARDFAVLDEGLQFTTVKIFKINTSAVLRILLILPV
jgi:hypothetical protein